MKEPEDRKELGKIVSVKFGYGGYQDAMIGISFTLGNDGWGIGDFWGDWAMDPSDTAEWTIESRNKRLGEIVMRIEKLLKDAKVQTIHQLKDTPVEVILSGNSLKAWRVLKEVV